MQSAASKPSAERPDDLLEDSILPPVLKRRNAGVRESSGNLEDTAQYYTFWSQVKAIVLSSWLVALLLPAVPAGFAVKYTNQSPVATFAVNFVAIIPLGRILDNVTEELTIRMGGHEGTFVVVTCRYDRGPLLPTPAKL